MNDTGLKPADCCPKCSAWTPAVSPYSVAEDETGQGVVARYRCRRGHTWWTSWAYSLIANPDPWSYE